MRRRLFACSAAAAAAWPLLTKAQRSKSPARLGLLGPGNSSKDGEKWIGCLRSGLRDLGWIEGKSLSVEYRSAEGIADRYRPLAAELVSMAPDVIIATSTPGAQAAQRATRSIPIVFVAVSDPVASGLVATLARPGGNITGVSNFLPSTSGKLLELLKVAAPGASRFGVLYNPSNAGKVLDLQEIETAAKVLGMAIEPLGVRSSDDLEDAFLACAQSRCNALVALVDAVTLANRRRITVFAEANRLPAIYQIKEFAESGGLMSYGLDYCRHYRSAASYVDKILKGAQPADLPVELPTRFDLVINLAAAKALGVVIPQSLRLRADELIQ